jgi:hypothetical protein
MREEFAPDEEQVLLPEKDTYPWQIMEGDGQTWLILRWREKVSKRPIAQLGHVRLEDFQGKVSYENRERKFFSGAIALTITYWVSPTERKPYVVNEPWREESTCEEFFMKEVQSPFWAGRKREDELKDNGQAEVSVVSSFLSLLLSGEDLRRREESLDKDKNEHEHEHEHEDEEQKVWLVQSPWRCWFRGNGTGGGIPVPECVKVHVAQVGLYTLLLEAVIKLESEAGEGLEKQAGDGREKQGADRPQEMRQEFAHRYLLRLEDLPPAEVLGVVAERAFPCLSYQLKEKMLGASFLKKFSLLYIKAREGGERFKIASHFTTEKLLFAGFREPVYPLLVQSKRVQSAVVPLGAQRWYYSETEVFRLTVALPEKQAAEESKAVKAVAGATVNTLPKRGKPGERWLKKGDGRNSKKTKTLITIKI